MKPILIKVLIGVIGFAGGFASGYLVHKKMNNIQFEEITEEEMDALEKDNHPVQASQEQVEESKTSEEIGAAQELPEKPDDIRNALQGKTPYMKADADTKTAYEKLWKATNEYSNSDNADQYPVWKSESAIAADTIGVTNNGAEKDIDKDTDEAEDSEEEFDQEFIEQLEQEAEAAQNYFDDPPHQIDLISFYNDHPDWDSITIHWYMEDNVWIDENEEKIPDIASYTGIKNLNPFNEEPIDDDQDIRFWANPQYHTNYEFIRHHRSWAEASGEVN